MTIAAGMARRSEGWSPEMISYKTAGGTDVSIAIRTEREITDDGLTISVPCYELQIWVGNEVWGGADVIEHPQHGWVLKAYMGGKMVKVSTEHRTAIVALLDEYNTESNRRLQAALAADCKYEAHRAVMRKVLGSACVDE